MVVLPPCGSWWDLLEITLIVCWPIQVKCLAPFVICKKSITQASYQAQPLAQKSFCRRELDVPSMRVTLCWKGEHISSSSSSSSSSNGQSNTETGLNCSFSSSFGHSCHHSSSQFESINTLTHGQCL